jgi:chromate transporter
MEEPNVPQTSHSKGALLRKLFVTMLYISSFTFGGGFVIVTFMKRKFVDELHWMDETEMLDITALAQASPGGIAVNASILVGWRVAGLAGMVVAVVGTILPPMVILTIVSYFYAFFATNTYVALVLKGMQAGVAAVILDVVCSMGGNVLKSKKVLYIALMVAAFVANVLFSVNVIYIILAAAAVGILAEVIGHLRGGKTGNKEEDAQ